MALQTILDATAGWLDAKEAALLHELAGSVTDGCIVEIGSYRGRSTLVMATAAKVSMYCIDPYIPSDNEQFSDEDRVVWMRNILGADVAHKVRSVNLKSTQVAQVWDEPVSLLFVDGNHSYESVIADLSGWFPHVKPGGYIACHDSEWIGVKDALGFFYHHYAVKEVFRVEATTVFEVSG